MENSGFWLILSLGFLFGVIHSTLASSRIKAFAARVFGLKASRHYRLFMEMPSGKN